MTKIRELREKYLPYEEKTVRKLCISATMIFIWLLIWMLLFKFARDCDKAFIPLSALLELDDISSSKESIVTDITLTSYYFLG